ncbi:MAG TPA: carboxypeptidase-like regulatory domain-containing protein [Blastocatellia bacterium]|nr:carboxypeptidase-like regulatory domain-containing protein [Blastocatellia bacterium]
MRTRLLLWLVILLMAFQFSGPLTYGQGSSVSSLSGVVTDPSGAVIENATVEVKSNATGATFKTKTSSNGTFIVPALSSGLYTVAVSAPGFKQVIVSGIKVDTGAAASVRVSLEVGTTSEAITVQGGAEVLQTQSANITTTVAAREIQSLPVASRDVLVFLTLLPGMNTTGTYRTTTVNGFTRSAVNIMIDGVMTQDQVNKDSEFFSRISPRLDSIEEVTVSSATPGVESSGQGSVQIRFVTRRGNNDYHGSLYEYHRNTWLNSNYWFNNRDLPPDPKTGKAPRDRIILNQFGFRVGGPISLPKKLFGPVGFDGHDRAFFFVNHEQYRLPIQVSRQRTVLNPLAQRGVFQYNVLVSGQNQVRQVDLLALAARQNNSKIGSTIDPTVGKLLEDIQHSTEGTGSLAPQGDPNLQRFTFSNATKDANSYSTVRLDFNLTHKHSLENSANIQAFHRSVDILNNVDPAFPGFPNTGEQKSTRFSNSTALRSTLTATLQNEARVGFAGGTTQFNPNVGPESFSGPIANQAGFSLNLNGAAGITNAAPVNAPSRRNAPIFQFSDTVNWQRDTHNLNFGFEFAHIGYFNYSKALVPSINFGVDSNDPANNMFSAANFQGASTADLNRARGIYALLTGRVTAINATSRLDEETNKYVYLGAFIQRTRQREMGFFGQDSWRARPNLTLNYGLRWEIQLPFTALNGIYSTTTVEGLFGVSGPGNLFKPGVLQGKETEFTQFEKGDPSFETRYRNFAPSVGFAWSPSFKSGLLKRIMGDSGRVVMRGGYSLTYNRRGITNFSDNINDNPGNFVTTNRNQTLGNLVSNNNELPILLSERNRLGAPAFPESPTYPLKGAITDAATILDPHLKMPYGQSWTFGIQREIAKDTAFEVRYIGTRTVRNLETINFNEVNIVENGFFDEFKNAIANLRANIAAGRGTTFRYFGPNTGTFPLPIILAHFSGKVDPNVAGSYTSSNFSNGTFVNRLSFQNASPYGLASDLYGNSGRRANALAAGLPVNLFFVNPGLQGGAQMVINGASQSYHALAVELRRRLTQGLLVQGSYTYARAFTSIFRSLRVGRVNGVSTEQAPHAFKAEWIYELPFGRGRALLNDTRGAFDRLIGGWEFAGTARIQSGTPINLGNVRLVGMSRTDLQKALKLRFDDANKVIYSLPQDIIDNTIKAFNTSATSATGYGDNGVPTGRYIAPANSATCIEVIGGDCGGTRVQIYAPRFTRIDLSAVKRTKISERLNFEFRAEFLNAFNYANFNVGLGGFGNADFGRVTSAYRDNSNTNDLGGRIVQLVGRINF